MPAGVGISSSASAREAVEEAAEGALRTGIRPDAALLFAGPGFANAVPQLLEVAKGCLGSDSITGAIGHGVLAAGRDVEDSNGVALLVVEGLDAKSFLISDLSGDESIAGSEIAARLDGEARAEDLVVLLPDSGALKLDAVLASVQEELAPALVVGAGAADPIGAAVQWGDGRAERGGLAGLVLRGKRPPRVGVTQACRPVTPTLCVTRTQGHWVLGIDDRPALDVYREIARGPLAADLRRAATFLLVAIPRSDAEPLRPGDYLVRHVVGFDEARSAFAIPEALKPGDRIAFAQREPQAAREDLKAMLAQVGDEPPGLGLYFNCCARGAGFFGVPGLEAAYLESAFGSAPIAGLFGSCEIGPIAGTTELLTYTAVLALLDA